MQQLQFLVVLAVLAFVAWAVIRFLGWRHMRTVWKRPVTFRDYLAFSKASVKRDFTGIMTIARKYGAGLSIVLMLALPAIAGAHDPFNDPAYPGVTQQQTPECPPGFDCAGFTGTIGHMPGQFQLIGGHAQIGHEPGRTDLLHPTEKPLSLGQNVRFIMKVKWNDISANPCAKDAGCTVRIGVRHRPDFFMDTWTTFTFHADAGDRQFLLDLPSKSDENVLPCGHHDIFVSITGDKEPLGSWFFPVDIHADRCPGR